MNKILPGIFLILFFQVGWSQQSYFVYLQTTEGAPFYLKMNDRVYSSGANGYFILPNLPDGSYQFALGLSNSSIAEEKFSLMLNTKDHGYSIITSNDGLVLANLQTNAIIKPQKTNQVTGYSYTKRTDAFTTLLAKALADTSLFYQAVYTEMQPKLSSTTNERIVEAENKQTIAPPNQPIADSAKSKPVEANRIVSLTPKMVEAIDTAGGIASNTDTVALAVQNDQTSILTEPNADSLLKVQSNKIDSSGANKAEEIKPNILRSQITRYSESSTSEGFGVVYIDASALESDTIRLLIQNPNVFIPTGDTVMKKNYSEASLETDSLKVSVGPMVRVNAAKPMRKNVCVSQATGADFTKLRRSMSAKNTEEKRIDEAKKMFRSKCFTTEEIKMLSALFLSDSGKYRFFDEAYIYVSNSETFASLVSEISDEYYVKRFRALIGE